MRLGVKTGPRLYNRRRFDQHRRRPLRACVRSPAGCAAPPPPAPRRRARARRRASRSARRRPGRVELAEEPTARSSALRRLGPRGARRPAPTGTGRVEAGVPAGERQLGRHDLGDVEELRVEARAGGDDEDRAPVARRRIKPPPPRVSSVSVCGARWGATRSPTAASAAGARARARPLGLVRLRRAGRAPVLTFASSEPPSCRRARHRRSKLRVQQWLRNAINLGPDPALSSGMGAADRPNGGSIGSIQRPSSAYPRVPKVTSPASDAKDAGLLTRASTGTYWQ